MKIAHLPDDLGLDSKDDVQLFSYSSEQNIIKAKINLHRHTISFLRSGVKEVIGQGQSRKVSEKSFLIMKSGHCLMTEKLAHPDMLYRSILLFFNDEAVMRCLKNLDKLPQDRNEKNSLAVFHYDDYIKQFVDSLELLLELPAESKQIILQVKFEEIIHYLAYKHGYSFLVGMLDKLDDRQRQLQDVVGSNRLTKLSIDELAFLCHMSVSTFKRAFVKIYQETPMKWFSEQRLQHCATLLQTGSHRPIDIYEQAGYENLSNFIQAFKKKFGVTPKQFQNQCLNF